MAVLVACSSPVSIASPAVSKQQARFHHDLYSFGEDGAQVKQDSKNSVLCMLDRAQRCLFAQCRGWSSMAAFLPVVGAGEKNEGRQLYAPLRKHIAQTRLRQTPELRAEGTAYLADKDGHGSRAGRKFATRTAVRLRFDAVDRERERSK
ncbi:hypothetical protein B0H13DRAFT_1896111 [Mycena leptocephala]|nr:hypothetical protein B0H13DRAFT_1896111 [Mycena leptocephala]